MRISSVEALGKGFSASASASSRAVSATRLSMAMSLPITAFMARSLSSTPAGLKRTSEPRRSSWSSSRSTSPRSSSVLSTLLSPPELSSMPL